MEKGARRFGMVCMSNGGEIQGNIESNPSYSGLESPSRASPFRSLSGAVRNRNLTNERLP